MNYQISASVKTTGNAVFKIRQEEVAFGVHAEEKDLANPAELLLGAFAACCLKNVERFSKMMRFQYERAEIEVKANRQDAPPKITSIQYEIQIFSTDEKLNINLLHRNIQKYGTIYNTLKSTCEVSGEISSVLEDWSK